MASLTLAVSTGNQQVDAILTGTIGLLETILPGRIRAYYLHGSFYDHTGIETSDIDLFVVARENFSTAERTQIQQIMHYCALFSPFMAELNALDETSLLKNGHYRIKSASNLVWGEDIREQLPVQSFEQYLQFYAAFPFIYSVNMLRNRDSIELPLAYPDPEGEFYGYDQALMPPQNERRRNIKKFVTNMCWIATLLIAWKAGKEVEGKQASIQLYRQYVNDEWSDFVEEVYSWGNQRWHYLIPEQPEERRRLRKLCQQALAFEQHYLDLYVRYLQAEIASVGPGARAAAQKLAQIRA
ncbi:hypothetical protein [Dictyobacter kobayashii]|uniref:Polymerase beta nucleotidyltransferase domain-containing protein n=1 Tax=Dictyobacter kobayashii TaxID=2014872 RepID=A0A402AQ09_9CHLR|nr:hypothetical protein [Dictyobacter kobayashii]GCE21261.1 hypothetical protein KDK_50610 [Dictyobacter kobayashii]